MVAYAADVGQEEELSGLPEKAKATGAVDCVVRDLREEFVSDYVFPSLRGAALYEGSYLLGTALARSLIAKVQVEVAREMGCDAVLVNSAIANAGDPAAMGRAFAQAVQTGWTAREAGLMARIDKAVATSPLTSFLSDPT